MSIRFGGALKQKVPEHSKHDAEHVPTAFSSAYCLRFHRLNLLQQTLNIHHQEK
jgi:hypothetical protein